MKRKLSVFLAAVTFGGLPLTAGAFGGGHMVAGHPSMAMAGGRPGMAMGHPGMGLHGFNRAGVGHGFRGPGNGFAFRHDGRFHGRAFVHDGHFFHHHRHFFRSDFAFVGFGFPYAYYPYYPYYSYPYYGYVDDYPYDDYSYGSAEATGSPNDLAMTVQSELTRLGYYHGPIDGELGPRTRHAIRAFQAAKGLPVTGRVDPKFLRTLERG